MFETGSMGLLAWRAGAATRELVLELALEVALEQSLLLKSSGLTPAAVQVAVTSSLSLSVKSVEQTQSVAFLLAQLSNVERSISFMMAVWILSEDFIRYLNCLWITYGTRINVTDGRGGDSGDQESGGDEGTHCG